MNLRDKNIVVLGLAISGVSTAKALYKLGSNIIITDMKKENELMEYINQLEGVNVKYVLGNNDVNLDGVDMLIKSPGVPLEVPIIKEALGKGIEVVTDIELAYRLSQNKIIAITGTNGKTTTTALTGKIFQNAGNTCHITGNIGVGILWELVNSSEDDIFVVETSSFQLESTESFKPFISIIINITPDHINWHKSFDNYVNAKKKVFANQNKDDYTILNYDDPILTDIEIEVNSNLIYFSTKQVLDKGVYIEDGDIIINDGKEKIKVMSASDVQIPHLQNALASISAAWIMDVDLDTIVKTLENFAGVEHRLEFLETIDGINFYNDSKGTNPDASMKALEVIESPIVLIAGGMDKGSDFEEFVEKFDNKVKALVLLGETAEKIKNTAIKQGFNNIYIVKDMKEAVEKSYEIATKGDNVLLSPACASWDMYKNFEVRGNIFINEVKGLRRA